MLREKLQKFARGDLKGNLANKFRQKRINYFLKLLSTEEKESLTILDIGGTDYYWFTLNVNDRSHWEIILLNPVKIANKNPQFQYVKGDGRNLSCFENDKIDIIYSNSVIEHVGNWDDQQKFALEVKRITKNYFIQTPNFYFPFEPYFSNVIMLSNTFLQK